MYLSELKIWNFRKFGSGSNDLNPDTPDLVVPFKKGVNILIGENDSGKTAIVDAIKIVLKTHSADWIRIEHEDFFKDTQKLRIELKFIELTPKEASHFTEWLGWYGEEGSVQPYLRVILEVSRRFDRILPFDIRAGVDEYGHQLTAEAREYLKATYLKPLRNANAELIPRKNSRLSQIFAGHEAFKNRENDHLLVERILELNYHIKNYFDGKDKDGNDLQEKELKGKELKNEIDKYLKSFANKSTQFEVSGGNLKSILESLWLLFENDMNLGLGSHNLLFISSELLHLNKKDWSGIRLGLIEEIEAHLHPQIQLQVVEKLQEYEDIQLIFTTHSPNIASKISLEKLIMCCNGNAYPMGNEYTKLRATDYTFLERFLDVTKSNLFFAKGVILVEGWAEELFLPALASKIGINLTEKGVSIVNLGNTAFLRYSRIFKREKEPHLELPVAIITDVDVKPDAYKNIIADTETEEDVVMADKISAKENKYNGHNVKTFVSPHWTLEYCLSLSEIIRKPFFAAVLNALKEQKEDEGVQDLTSYNTEIANIDTKFNNWGDAQLDIAFSIYNNYVLGKKISKSIIAQHFSEQLKNATITKEQIEADQEIKYLIDAIKYASGNN
ncbi:hypothetical protein GCM10007962_31190 [Yeosuana aromativorans]|uniref:ATP-dependent endonuclease n=1 Tax=Yeosuana aromativorans TaxID=288019 RepID=A0A8J3BS54_9FLAO|nr:AAA family ATPase [Yeosuana aromativorans]GGK34508.1 hypothetical protein GCM10007962_31190 [Yeosuana aromativorans]